MKHFSVKAFSVCLFLAIIALLHCPVSFAYEEEIKDISTNMARDIADAGKKTIAVADFTDLQGNVTELGRFLAEEFSVALAGAGTRFEVVDRIHLKSIIREHKLSATGMIDPKTARKLGKIAGVQALITGTVTPFGDNVRITVKILDTETAKIIGASTANIAKTKAIEELLARGIELGRPGGQELSPTDYSRYTNTRKSQKAGELTVSVEKVVVSKNGQVRAILNFYDRSDEMLSIIEDHFGSSNYPVLSDEKGTVFKYQGGGLKNTIFINPKCNSSAVLYFEPKNGVTGSVFAVTVPFFGYVL
jgi:TolB-like protein